MSHKEQKIVVTGVLKHKGRYLVVRPAKPEFMEPGGYTFPGGRVKFGEAAEEALKRIFKDKLNISVQIGNVIRSYSYIIKSTGEHMVVFDYHVRAQDLGDEPDIKMSHDFEDWMLAEDIKLQHLELYEETKNTFKTLGLQIEKVTDQLVKVDENTTQHDVIIAYTDGGSRGNPGPSASGYVLMTEEEKLIEEGGEYLGITTNNQAEYQAVKLALEQVKKYNAKKVHFFIDSLLVVNQMTGKFKIKNKELWPVHAAIKDLATEFEEVTFTHVRREYNTLADGKVNEVLDSYEHGDR